MLSIRLNVGFPLTRTPEVAYNMNPLRSRENSCCFTGHRPEKLPWDTNESDMRCVALKKRILEAAEKLYQAGIRHFICGMARGSDTYFCEAIIALRDKHPDISLEAAIPFENQAANWPIFDRARYDELVGKCSEATYVSRDFTRSCMHLRNRYMVDNASVLIAVFDGKRGGTHNTVKYAQRSGLEIIVIIP